MKMKHGNTLVPMGWDAFGLPAENAAIKAKKNPIDMVPKNYGNFRSQMKNLSFDFDWKHEFATTDPSYYGFTQWLFLHLYDAGLVYKEEVAINWCPKCLTGLANEEVMGDGTHERCGTVVTKKNMPQWVMKITDYAQRLLDGLDENLPGSTKQGLDWPRGILEMQRNWIGKKEGMRLFHQVEGLDLQLDAFSAYPIWCFADTFMVIAPEHPLVNELVKGTEYEKAVKDFVEESGQITAEQRTEDKFEKKGVFTGRYTNDPFNPGSKLPVWVANFAMMGFGTGIIRCSAHDPRDYEFAQKYDIKLKEVVERTDNDLPVNAHTNEGILKDSGVFSGVTISEKSIEDVKNWIEKEGIGKRETTWHLRDWVFSRQRYWGEPIPLVYCDKCGDSNGVVPLSEKDLPLELPYLESYEPTDTGESPLSRIGEWVNTKCPKCGGNAKRETDTMPNWAGSCWYFLAFPWWSEQTKAQLDEFKNKSETPYTDFWKAVAKPQIDKWLPVDWYLGGAEHAVLHLLYARFWVKVFQDRGLLDFSEPFLRLRSVGMVLATDGKKMSKSLGNVINPDEMVSQFGSDAVRLYEMFMGPWDQAISWDTRSLIGQKRFIERIVETVKKTGDKTSPILSVNLAKLGEKVERGIVEQKFNTAIASLMEFVNLWRGSDVVMSQYDVNKFAQLLSPFAPQTAQAVCESSSDPVIRSSSVSESMWPTFDEVSEISEVPVVIAIQVNGKLRATIEIESAKSKIESEVMKVVMQNEQVKKWAVGVPKKVIFVSGKLVNLVV
jgi:leucyl-tRNA synthetase